MSESQKKGWKLAFIAVPVIIANIGSYMQSRAESQDESKASYEALKSDIISLKKEANEDHDHLVSLEARVVVLTDLLEKANVRAPHAHVLPMTMKKADAGTDGDGIPDQPEPFPKPFVVRKVTLKAELPSSFEDVVQRYKAARK
jgi:hypothetical protein